MVVQFQSDPYYLVHAAARHNLRTEVVLAGRTVNERMTRVVSDSVANRLWCSGLKPAQSRILVLGITYKANVSDCRNSKIIEVINDLLTKGVGITIVDPLAVPPRFLGDVDFKTSLDRLVGKYHLIIYAVPHVYFEENFTVKTAVNFYEEGCQLRALIDLSGDLSSESFSAVGIEVDSW